MFIISDITEKDSTVFRNKILPNIGKNWASQVALVVENNPANAGDLRDMCSIPGLGRSPEGGHGKIMSKMVSMMCNYKV